MNGTDKDPQDEAAPDAGTGPDEAAPDETARPPGGEEAGSDLSDRFGLEAAEADTRTREDLVEETADLKDKLLRALAEAQNSRRRAQREREDAAKYAISSFARELLDVQDNLIRALASISPEDKAAGGETLATLYEGVEMTQRVLHAAFERHKIEILNPAGEKFDPNFHQAVAEIPDTGRPGGSIVDVMQTGYLIGDRLLRPAMVTVARGDGAAAGDDEEPGGAVDTSA